MSIEPLRDLPPNPAIPWHLICREALRGASLEGLARRFNVSVPQIEEQLGRRIKREPSGEVRLRTSFEINAASAQARNDLIGILQQAIEEMAASDKPRLAQLPEFEKLLSSAARLFQWPTVTTARVMATLQPAAGYGTVVPNGAPTSAVNLALINTSPSQLAVLPQDSADDNGGVLPQESQSGIASRGEAR